jgi:hypothetical protein
MYRIYQPGIGNGPVVGSCQHSNEPHGSVKCRKFVEKLGGYHLIENYAPCSMSYSLSFGRRSNFLNRFFTA